MPPRSQKLLLRVFVLFALAFATARAAAPEWKDTKGATFRGEPVEVVGPMALFRTGAISSKFLPMRALSPEDCVRFYQAIAARPPRAERWSEAQGELTRELVGRLTRTESGKQRPVNMADLPEPELVVAFLVGQRRDGSPWHVLDNLTPFVGRVQRVYPGRVATVVVASRAANFNPGSLGSARTWFAVDPGKLLGAKVLARYLPGEGVAMVLFTREGVPLFGAPANDVAEVTKFVDGASDFLWELNPANPRTARDRLHYLRAVRPVEFAERQTGPLLLIDPLRVDALRQRGVTGVAAKFEVAADGAIAGVELKPESGVPAPLVPALTEALKRSAFFLPAIARGTPVAGSYDYQLKIPAANPQLAADAAWLNGEARVDVPFKSWLVLKAVRVPEQVFSTIAGVSADGTVMLSAVTAGSSNKVSTASQMNSFNSDWFDGAGAASVQPVAGQKQEVDGEKLTWKEMKPDHGLVDFLGSATVGKLDYCVGYAWTEVEVPEDTDAWLGIGSDDGLKVWLNGDQVNDKWIARTSRLDDDVVALRLRKGKNQFLIKIQNVRGLWSFTARLRVRGN